jgi:hypothetical protein
MSISHCTFGYHQYGTSALDTFAGQVFNGIYTNPTQFHAPPVEQESFSNIQQDFSNAAAEYATYGAVKKTAFTNARKKLIDVLDLMADFVDGVANGDESLIILSGYIPSSTITQGNIPLTRIEMFMVKRTANEGEIAVEIPAINHHGSINYYCICSEGIPLAAPTIVDGQLILDNVTNKIRYDYSKARKKLFKGLTIATTYYFYVFASNTVSVAPISEVKSIMAA